MPSNLHIRELTVNLSGSLTLRGGRLSSQLHPRRNSGTGSLPPVLTITAHDILITDAEGSLTTSTVESAIRG